MNNTLLLQQFDLLATAPGGVARLRELILTLAVQGKLVPQNPADEPASALLKRIRAEKDRLIAEGKIKRDKPLAAIGEEEQPFALPSGWEWARLEQLSLVIVDCPHSTPKFVERGRLCLDTNSFKQGQLQVHKLRYVDEITFAERNARLAPEAGDMVFAREGSVGESILIPNGVEACLGQRVMLFRFSKQVSNEFVRLSISSASFLDTLLALHKGIGAKHVNVGDMRLALIPLPPLPEQARIVARVEELMRVCDALEATGQRQAAHHRQLVQTLLGDLTADSHTPWQRVAAHFDTLLDRPSAVDALEQTILQLAVRGQLVPQDPTDEPASALLQRIRTEKDRLIAAGKIKRDKPLAPIGEDEQPFELPRGWEWVRLPEIYYSISPSSNKLLSSAVEIEGRFPVVDQGQRPIAGYTNDQALLIEIPGPVIVFGDHTKAIKHIDFDFVAGADGTKILRPVLQDEKFFAFQLRSFDLEDRGYARHFKVLNAQLFALPPLPEQARIVARVAQLRRLCADLRQRLTQSQTTQAALAEALVAQLP